jgi:subtilisin family serine protease
MTRLVRQLALVLAAWLAAAGLVFAAAAAAPAADPGGGDQKVLVMFRLPPGHYRANGGYSDSYGDELGRSARRRMAGDLAREHGLTLLDDWPMPLIGVDCFIMRVPPGRSPDEAARALAKDKRIAWAEPLNLYRAQSGALAHNDPLFPVQPAARRWRLGDLHEIATGRNVRVAVVDSMVDAAHPDLAGQVQVSENFVAGQPAMPEQHGTGVAGIIAARADNGLGMVGVAPRARLLALRACWQAAAQASGPATTVCDSLSLARALVFAITHDAQVINLSLSGPPDRLLGALIDAALARGVAVVGAFDPSLPRGGFPASHAGVIAVADDLAPAPPSGVYTAPGRDIPTTQPGGRWRLVDGSSYSAAHVSGLLALMREKAPRPAASPVLVAAAGGGGAIDACATLLRVYGPCQCACARAPQLASAPGR